VAANDLIGINLDLFGGAFDPTHAGWNTPVPDAWTYRLPDNARRGTYLVTIKGRVYS
jgi:hypothetical protein